MIRAIFYCPTGPLQLETAARLRKDRRLELVSVIDGYPEAALVAREVRFQKPDVVFLSNQDAIHFERIVRGLETIARGLPVVSVGGPADADVLLRMMNLGIREHLAVPIKAVRLTSVVQTIETLRLQNPATAVDCGDLYSFLPARGGVGASTLAAGVSSVLANDLNVRTLLLDGDLAAGTIQFQLNLANPATILDALQMAGDLDDQVWADLIGRHMRLDVLHTGGSDYYPDVPAANLLALLGMARKRYSVIGADLGANVNPFTETLLRESRQIFLVTAPRLTALRLALGKLARLTDMGLRDRVTVLLNRKPRSKAILSAAEVGKILGNPPLFSFYEDGDSTAKAVMAGAPVAKDTALGAGMLTLASALAPSSGPGPEPEAPKGRKYLEIFRISRPVCLRSPLARLSH